MSVKVDADGVYIKTPSREMKLSWRLVSVHRISGYVLISHRPPDGTIIPEKAFGGAPEATQFVEQATAWWREGQLPAAQRLARYLADRDAKCPRCAYNLRGLASDRCPECGETFSVESLQLSKQ
jgi:hypothetical protein